MKKGKSTLFSFKPTASIIALSVAAAFALTACGGGGGDDDDNGGGNGGSKAIGYVTQLGTGDGTGSILRCDTASGGMLTCAAEADTTLAAITAPTSIALAGNYAYILNAAESGEAIYSCAVDKGTLSTCTLQEGATELTGAKDLAVSANNMYVLKEGQLLQCELANGTVGACSDERDGYDVTGLNVAESMAFSGNRVWIANSGGTGSILTCDVANGDGGTGVISGCTDSGWAATGEENPAPMGIAVSGTNAYIVLRDTNSVQRCTIGETDGAVTLTCDEAVSLTTATTAGAQPYRIALNGNYAYITSASETAASNSVIKCTIGSAGIIEASSCVSAITASDTSPITGEITDIAF